MKGRIYLIILASFAIIIGIYPSMYLLIDAKIGVLTSKDDQLLNSMSWWTAFYGHIIFGGLSLLFGWSQFFPKWRSKYVLLHRILGKAYVISVTISGISAAYLALFATGGLVSSIGFGMLAILWLFTTWKAFLHIKSGHVDYHKRWVMRSYALAFAAVTLRIWLPLSGIIGIEFLTAYKIIAWLCWVPNLLLIEWVIARNTINQKAAINT